MALPNGILFKSMFVEKFFLEIVDISHFERIGVQQVGTEVRAKLAAPGSFSVAMFRLDRFVIFAVQLVTLHSFNQLLPGSEDCVQEEASPSVRIEEFRTFHRQVVVDVVDGEQVRHLVRTVGE